MLGPKSGRAVLVEPGVGHISDRWGVPRLRWGLAMFRYMMALVLLVLVFAAPAAAVDTLQVRSPEPVLEPWRWTEFSQSSGLAGGVRDIFEDWDGSIWFATHEAVARYVLEQGLTHSERFS